MPKIFAITKFAVRRDDGTVKELPYGCYAYEFYSKCNYKYVITMRKDGKYDILDLTKMRVIYSSLPDITNVIKRLEEYDEP